MADALNTYKSTLTPQEVDEALKKIGNVDESIAAAAESAAEAKQYADSINPSSFATAAQGHLAQTAVQTVNGKSGPTVNLVSDDVGAPAAGEVLPCILTGGLGGVLNKEGQSVNFLIVDINNATGSSNTPYIFGAENPSILTNTPYSGGAFYGLRLVICSGHLTTVLLIEQYPTAGRVWANTYDKNASNWLGWVQHN